MRFPSGYNDNPPAATIMLLLFPGSLPFLLSSSPGQTCVCITDTYLSSKSETQFSVNHYLVGEPTHCQPQSLLYIHSYLHFHRPYTFASLHITHIRLSNKNNNNNLSSSNYFPFPISHFLFHSHHPSTISSYLQHFHASSSSTYLKSNTFLQQWG